MHINHYAYKYERGRSNSRPIHIFDILIPITTYGFKYPYIRKLIFLVKELRTLNFLQSNETMLNCPLN